MKCIRTSHILGKFFITTVQFDTLDGNCNGYEVVVLPVGGTKPLVSFKKITRREAIRTHNRLVTKYLKAG